MSNVKGLKFPDRPTDGQIYRIYRNMAPIIRSWQGGDKNVQRMPYEGGTTY